MSNQLKTDKYLVELFDHIVSTVKSPIDVAHQVKEHLSRNPDHDRYVPDYIDMIEPHVTYLRLGDDDTPGISPKELAELAIITHTSPGVFYHKSLVKGIYYAFKDHNIIHITLSNHGLYAEVHFNSKHQDNEDNS